MRNTKKLLFCVLFTLLSVFAAKAQYTGYDYVATFASSAFADVQGTLGAAPGSGTISVTPEDGLKVTVSAASGGRQTSFTLRNAANSANRTISFTNKLIVEFDWYLVNYAGGNNDEGQIQFRSSTATSNNTLFTIFCKSGSGNTNQIGVVAGGPSGTALSTTMNAAQRTFIPATVNTWYHVKAEVYAGQRLCVTVTNEDGYFQQAMLPFASGFSLTALTQLYFNMTRTGNITWDTRIKNLGIKEASADPAVAASKVNTSSEYEMIYAGGGTAALSAVVEPFDVSNHVVTWSVNNNLATVTAGTPSWNATLTGANNGGGVVIVTATSATAGILGTKEVYISAAPIPLNNIAISGSSAVSVNATTTLSTTVGPGNAADKTVVWSSLNPEIATVSSSGVVTGVSEGVATIQATATDGGGAVATHNVTVSITPVSYIDMQGAEHIFTGTDTPAPFTITPVISPSDASFKTLTWSTTDASVVNVSSSGQVTFPAEGYGKAYVKASSTDGSGVEGYYYIERYETTPFDLFQNFQSNNTGFTLTGFSRSTVQGSSVLSYTQSGQSGGRSATATIADANIPRGGVIDLRFDWYAPEVTTTQNSGVLSIQDAAGTKILSFIADNYSKDASRGDLGDLLPLRYLVGDYLVGGDAYPPASMNLENVSALNRWYIIEVRFDFLKDEMSFTFTDRCDPTKFHKVENLPLSVVTPSQANIRSFFFNGLRTATHNITFNNYMDNVGWKIVDANLPTYEVMGMTMVGLDQVAPGEKILVYPKISPLNAINKGITFESSDPSIATVEMSASADHDGMYRGVVTGVSEGTVTITARSVQKPEIFVEEVVTVAPAVLPQRQMERLDRGLVAVRTGSNVFLSWRLFATDPANISFNIYKNNSETPCNPSPLGAAYTNFNDTYGAESDTYKVAVLVGSTEIYRSKPAEIWTNQYKSIPVQKPTGYLPNGETYTNYTIYDGSTADLDGDGEYEIVFLWAPSNLQDNSNGGLTGNVYIDAYKLDGTKLWGAGKWIDLGCNIRAGAHYLPYLVYDFDGDGKAEIVIRTADRATDTQGKMIGNPNAPCFANSDGFVLEGPEYVTVFEGATGKLLDYKPYSPERGDVRDWGDGQGNRADRFLACVAFLDGERPSAVMCRGYYTRSTLAAWDWDGKELKKRWIFDSNEWGRQYTGQGNHNLSVLNNLDGTGKDCIIYGSMTIKYDGTPMYATGLGHGDAMHAGKLDPNRPGLQVMNVHESPFPYGMEMHDALTGDLIWAVTASNDIGRGNAVDIDPMYPGVESWGSGGMSTRSSTGQALGSAPGRMNMAIYWDGDTGRELLDGGSGPSVTKINPSGTAPSRSYSSSSTLTTFTGASTNGGSKNNPCLQADILGDWREEVILRVSGDNELRIYTTTTATSHTGNGAIPESGIPTLMHDPTYRMAIAWQNVGYNQPPHTGFFLGYNMTDVTRDGGAEITVTLDPDGGAFDDDNSTSLREINTISGSYFELPEVSWSDGSTFVGWYFADDTKFDPTAIYKEDISLIAKGAKIFTLSFETQTSDITDPEDKDAFDGMEVGVLPIVYPPTGYDFSGWNTEANGSGETVTPSTVLTSTGDITLYAQYEAQTYIMSFDTRVASIANPASKPVIYDAEVGELPVLERTGYVFDGWNTRANGSGTTFTESTILKIADKFILYAQWTANKYKLSFDTQVADIANPDDQIVTYDIELGELPTPERAGYTFDGWNLEQNGSGEFFTKSTVFLFTNDVTLYAQWHNTYTLSFDTQAASIANPASKTVTNGIEVGELSVLERTGYVFDGWNLKPDGSGEFFTKSTVFLFTNDVTLYAKWTANTYTLSFDTQVAEITNPDDKTVTYDAEIGELTVPERVGYTFKGWNTKANGYGVDLTESMVFTFTEDILLYAKWEINTYILSFNIQLDGVATPASKTITYNTAVGVLPAPSCAGYTFTGWNTQADGLGNTFTAATVFLSTINVILYAQWEANTYTLYFSAQAAKVSDPASITVTYDKVVGVLPSLERTGYEFDGWNTQKDGSGDVFSASTVFLFAKNVTIYAQWVAKNYTLDFDTQVASIAKPESKLVSYDGAVGELPALTIREGFVFAGWNTKSNGSGERFSASTIFLFTANTTLYAHWLPVTLFPAAGAPAVAINSQVSVTFEKNILIPGHNFSGITIKNGTTNYFTGATIDGNKLILSHSVFSAGEVIVTIPANALSDIEQDIVWSFTADYPPFVLSAFTPAKGATNVTIPTAISVTLDNVTSLSDCTWINNVTVKAAGDDTNYYGSTDVTANKISITPLATLPYNKVITVTISKEAVPAQGGYKLYEDIVWSFTTGQFGLVVTDRTPAVDAPAAAVNVPVTLKLNNRVDINGTPNLNKINISETMGVSATFNNDVITINHNDFAPNTRYTVTVPKDAVPGLTADVVWSFTTGIADIMKVKTVPENNATNEDVNVEISITFNKNPYYNAAPNWSLVSIKDVSGTPVSGIVVNGTGFSGNSYSISHERFAPNTKYTVTIPKEAITGLDADIVWAFTTAVSTTIDTQTGDVVMVYPTITSDKVFVKTAHNAKIRVADLTGKLIIQTETTGVETDIVLDNYSAGIYFVSVEINGTTSVHKIVKK
jgi:Listeria/Bacterioides repeat